MAGRLFDRLADRYGEDAIFMDVDSIEPGLDFGDVIDRAVGACDVLIALIGPAWLGETDGRGRWRLADPNDTVALEIKAALDRNIRLIPVLVDGAVMPQAGELPQTIASLARRNSVRIDHETFRRDVEPLMEVLARMMMAGPRIDDSEDRRTRQKSPSGPREERPRPRHAYSDVSSQDAPRPPGNINHRGWGGGLIAGGAIFLLAGFLFRISILWTLGILLAVIGIALMVVGIVRTRS
jgi:hypothetical protein